MILHFGWVFTFFEQVPTFFDNGSGLFHWIYRHLRLLTSFLGRMDGLARRVIHRFAREFNRFGLVARLLTRVIDHFNRVAHRLKGRASHFNRVSQRVNRALHRTGRMVRRASRVVSCANRPI